MSEIEIEPEGDRLVARLVIEAKTLDGMKQPKI